MEIRNDDANRDKTSPRPSLRVGVILLIGRVLRVPVQIHQAFFIKGAR